MKPYIIGIAGGSGSGKSTVASGLLDRHSGEAALIHLDDYFVKRNDAPTHDDLVNWDDPRSIRFNDFVRDLRSLKSGDAVSVMTKSERYNPDYANTGRIPLAIVSKPLIIAEDWMLFWHPQVRELLDLKIYLEAPHDLRAARRTKLKGGAFDRYNREILAPMHAKHVAPTKQYADYVFDATTSSAEEIIARVDTLIPMISKT